MCLPIPETFSQWGGDGGNKMTKKKNTSTTESPVQSNFCSVFGSRVCMLGGGGERSDKSISLYNLGVFLHSGCLSALVPNCPSFKSETTAQRADMERWEAGGECSYSAVEELRGTASGSRRLFQRILLPRGNQRLDLHLNNVKVGTVMTWYPCS